MSDTVANVRIKTGVRGAWYVVFSSALLGALLLEFAGHGERPYLVYNPDIVGMTLLVAAAICFPVMVSAHVSSLAGYRELSRRQCQVVKLSTIGAFVMVWAMCRIMDVAAFAGYHIP